MNDLSAHLHRDASKRYYRVREASAITGVPGYVLRFWESQFQTLKPKRTASGHRLYRKADLDLILAIKRLLYDEHFTIAGARQHLQIAPAATGERSEQEMLTRVYHELKQLRGLLDDPS
ncbi:MAG: MerR family transcriptional regulator [Desulfobacterales bacterium]|jgi:DNA-binding transcriptional MerR regulator|nr:MerR family transcriptional regulator [Desulfobacteraceae bacterium]MDD3990728.1 MerR family transcriptional regulator [Desulfobacteraceae bacterium]MDY0310995.1 MerR family transcriptional regulator [Desulfobacterales bacterium]